MFTGISVLIPTRHRPDRLRTLLESFDQTVTELDAELVFRVDDDDKETQDFLDMNDSHMVITGPRHQGYQSMPLFFNELLAGASGDVVMCGNDDMVFQTNDWPSQILDAANEYPDGLFDIGVSTLNEMNFPFSTVSKKATDRLGFLWDPRIFWGDIFLRDVMDAFGRCVMIPSVQIDHDWAGFTPDKVYLEQLMPGEYTKDIMRRDPTYWTGTHRVAVDEAVEKLRGLLG